MMAMMEHPRRSLRATQAWSINLCAWAVRLFAQDEQKEERSESHVVNVGRRMIIFIHQFLLHLAVHL